MKGGVRKVIGSGRQSLISEGPRHTLKPVITGDARDETGLPIHYFIANYHRSLYGPEFTAKAVRRWLERLGMTTLFIEPGSPWGNGYVESFNTKLRDELLNREIFTTLFEAKVLIRKLETAV